MQNTTLTHTSFIGRSQEIDEICALLDDPACRLLTLVGPGGIGKSRLAMEVAARAREIFRDGIFFVPLATLTRSDDILTAIAEAMPFCFQQDKRDQREQFFEYLREKHAKHILLVLDNFEHLLDKAAIVSELLTATANLKIVITSREALNLQEEWVRQIAGLAYPEQKGAQFPEEYGAVQLFVDRARQIRGDFDPAQDIDNVVEICRLVEGMPLAIELAVGWLKTLQPAEIVREIQRGTDILATRLRNLPERHRSIRTVFNHSWLLLSDNERDVFRKLSIFRGGFTREAAEYVAGASLHIMAGVVDKSLVRLSASGRYDIHELLRQYGAEQLEDAGQADAVQVVYIEYYLGMLERLEHDIKGQHQIAALDAISAEFDNIRNAWHQAVERGHLDPSYYPVLSRAVESLSFYGDMRGRYHEVVAMMRTAVEQFPKSADDEQVYALRRIQARLIRLIVLGNMRIDDDLRARIEDCLVAARAKQDKPEIGFCLMVAGIVTVWLGSDTPYKNISAATLFRESYEVYEEIDDRFYMADVLAWGGCPAVYEQDQDWYKKGVAKSLDLRRQIGDRNGIAWITINLAEATLGELDYIGHERYAREGLALMREIGSSKGILHAMLKVAQSAILKGNLDEARKLVEELTDLADETNNLDGKTVSAALLAFLVCVMDEAYEEGAVLARKSHELSLEPFYDGHNDMLMNWGQVVADCGLGHFEAVRLSYPSLFLGRHDDPGPAAICLVLEAVVLTHKDDLPERAAQLLGLAFNQPSWANGWLHNWPLLARLRVEVARKLGEDLYQAAWESGRDRDLEATIRSVLGDGNLGDRHRSTGNESLVEPLSERELEVLTLIAGGLSNSDIADSLALTVGTVKTHARNIYGKLNVKSRTQAIAQASKFNLL